MQTDKEEIAQCWATPVYSATFSDSEDENLQLASVILGKEREFLSQVQSNDTDTLIFNKFSTHRTKQKLFEWEFDCIGNLYRLLKQKCGMFLKQNYPEFADNFQLDGWANVHRLSDWHGVHSHFAGGKEIISGVYWIRAPAGSSHHDPGGKLILFDPRGPFFPERKKIILEPVGGKLLIFPSWLQHEVTPLKCDDVRISISFDATKP